jgi:hypothetical protein
MEIYFDDLQALKVNEITFKEEPFQLLVKVTETANESEILKFLHSHQLFEIPEFREIVLLSIISRNDE